MIGKNTRLFGLMGPDLAANRLYQAYNYVFEANGVDAAFVNISVPDGKMRFTLENLGNSRMESLLLTAEAAASKEVREFFGAEGFVVRVDIKDGRAIPLIAPLLPGKEENELLEAIRLNFFEWFGYFPNMPEDTIKTVSESAPRDSILTRIE